MSELERLNKCPLCKSGLFLNYSQIQDHFFSKKEFLLCQCSKCDLVFTNPRPDKANIQEYYQSEEYISHKNKSNNLVNFLYKQVRAITLKRKLNLINSLSPTKNKLLDIGAGTGHFLEIAKNNGWKSYGIEPNPEAQKLLEQKGVPTYEDILSIPKGKKFTIITLFHVLEHIHDLRKSAKKIHKHLEENGTLIIAVPNIDSFDSKLYKQYWAAWDVPRHLYHFNKSSIKNFAEEFGFKITDIKPMSFDSFYISMLSEKYMNPENSPLKNLIKGVINGWKSNIWAKNNRKNYSSLMFILKKK